MREERRRRRARRRARLDKKKGKKDKKDKPVHQEPFGNFEDHVNFDLGNRRQRHYTELGREDEDHYGYLNNLTNEPAKSTQEKKDKKDSKDDHSPENLPHYGDEHGEIFNHDDVHSHYYDARHLPHTDHEYLAWPEPHVASHGQVDPKLSATVGNLNLDWPIPDPVHYYDTSDEHTPAVEDFQ